MDGWWTEEAEVEWEKRLKDADVWRKCTDEVEELLGCNVEGMKTTRRSRARMVSGLLVDALAKGEHQGDIDRC